MQAESGQTLETILRRKELERSIGEGVFYWGIGNALGTGIVELLRHTSQPEVLFSIMRTKPKKEDATPTSVLLWTGYIDAKGILQSLPPHALILSRGSTASGAKKRAYALVCYSEASLSPSSVASLEMSHFKNLGGMQGKIGFSQVTANIIHTAGTQTGMRYDINLRAFLKPPYFVTLAGPKIVLEKDREAIQRMVATSPTSQKWRAFVEGIRNRPYYQNSATELFALSSE